jgi:hypothetical protein
MLTVNNAGNTEDVYTATIVGASGPASANLVGLDGALTRTISSFRLPGLSTGAIELVLDLSTMGQGTATVQITSLSRSGLTATATATLSAEQTNVATSTSLSISPPQPQVGQPVTLTATVSAASGATMPSGNVTFIVDDTSQPAVILETVNGQSQASVTLSGGLAAGAHQVSAFYGGIPGFAPSQAQRVTLLISATTSSDGPHVTSVKRLGFHQMPTTLVLTFDEPLDLARAQDVRNYQIIGSSGQTIAIDSAVYDSSARTVTLHPHQRLDLHQLYQLKVLGTGPLGVADASGRLLDGRNTGQPGSDYRTTLTAANLVIDAPVPGGPARLAKLRGEISHVAARQAKQLAQLRRSLQSPHEAHATAPKPIPTKSFHRMRRSSH